MTLTFLNLGTPEILIFVVAFILIIAVGNFGKDTALGYWGSVLLALFATPLIAFIVILVLKYRQPTRS